MSNEHLEQELRKYLLDKVLREEPSRKWWNDALSKAIVLNKLSNLHSPSRLSRFNTSLVNMLRSRSVWQFSLVLLIVITLVAMLPLVPDYDRKIFAAGIALENSQVQAVLSGETPLKVGVIQNVDTSGTSRVVMTLPPDKVVIADVNVKQEIVTQVVTQTAAGITQQKVLEIARNDPRVQVKLNDGFNLYFNDSEKLMFSMVPDAQNKAFLLGLGINNPEDLIGFSGSVNLKKSDLGSEVFLAWVNVSIGRVVGFGKSRSELPTHTGKPIITMSTQNIMQGQANYLSIYGDGYVIFETEINLRLSVALGAPLRTWNTGMLLSGDMKVLMDYIRSSGFINMPANNNFATTPEGQAVNGDNFVTVVVDSGDLQKTVDAVAYLAYADMPYPLSELYTRLWNIAQSTSLVGTEVITDISLADFSTSLEAKITANDTTADSFFGSTVSLVGDTMVVGASNNDNKKGAAYVYVRSGTNWSLQAKLTASDAVAFSWFGASISQDGNTLVIGSPGSPTGGAVYVFIRTGSTWSQQAKLTGNDNRLGSVFGEAVSINGDTILVGDQLGNDQTGTRNGCAYVFVRNGTSWNQQAKLTVVEAVSPMDHFGLARFGEAVSVSGDTAIIGTPGSDIGGPNFGAAYVFVRNGGAWNQQTRLIANDSIIDTGLGISVSQIGDTVVIGAAYQNSSGGAAYIFSRDGNTWSQQSRLTASDGVVGDFFGGSVSFSGDTIVVGAGSKNSSLGAAYVFTRNDMAWIQQARLTASDGVAGDHFGNSVSVSGDTVVIGAGPDNLGGAQKDGKNGAGAYVYRNIISPSVRGFAATTVTTTSASLNGSLSSLGTVTVVNVFFDYGTTTAYGSTTATQAMTTGGNFNANITGLLPGTTYHFQAKAGGGTSGTASGPDLAFTTGTTPPSIRTSPASNVNQDSAILSGRIISLGTATSVNIFFEYGTTTAYGSTTSSEVFSGFGAFSADINGLLPDTTYHFRARAGDTIGQDMNITTSKVGISNFAYALLAGAALIALVAAVVFIYKGKRLTVKATEK